MKKINTVLVASVAAGAAAATALVVERINNRAWYKYVSADLYQKEKWVRIDRKVPAEDGTFEHRVAIIGYVLFRRGISLIVTPIYLIENGEDVGAIVRRCRDGKPLFINVNERFLELDKMQQYTVLLHEAGHIVNERYGITAGSERVYAKELAADKFAASLVGEETVYELLWKLTEGHSSVDSSVEELVKRAADLGDIVAEDLLHEWEEDQLANIKFA